MEMYRRMRLREKVEEGERKGFCGIICNSSMIMLYIKMFKSLCYYLLLIISDVVFGSFF